ncbi:uncharacterized protein K452DRAFT_66847 [Aplosporella prunicola CBS 121167]|uniref:Uncharacterized protein n=1 Tax=Aplosporella prunicola CBS 121167 TaxID=1176127 RepID=A0A6A6BUN5_9PEZI|nr:uncharacterized protein K452DRAFT_66847 [Aplosporella prunicola CBS 121167]KAF2146517.1 hypothetical protein K452DRAFT_66847 [Aplosporella prunicola CBS 121167]
MTSLDARMHGLPLPSCRMGRLLSQNATLLTWLGKECYCSHEQLTGWEASEGEGGVAR